MAETVMNYIDGVWTESVSREWFESRNPADRREVVAVVVRSVREDVDQAVAAASVAQRHWRFMPAPKRGELLFRAAELLLRSKDALGRMVTREMGKAQID